MTQLMTIATTHSSAKLRTCARVSLDTPNVAHSAARSQIGVLPTRGVVATARRWRLADGYQPVVTSSNGY